MNWGSDHRSWVLLQDIRLQLNEYYNTISKTTGMRKNLYRDQCFLLINHIDSEEYLLAVWKQKCFVQLFSTVTYVIDVDWGLL